MKIYVFGNPDVENDCLAIKVAREMSAGKVKTKLEKDIFDEISRLSGETRHARNDPPSLKLRKGKQIGMSQSIQRKVEFVFVKPNEDLPFVDEEEVVIMDVVEGIDKVTVITEEDLDKLVLPPRSSAHEYDLGFQLRYLKKLGKIHRVKIIGLPVKK